MARVNNLSNFLTDVASAIKTKKGSETAIPAANFDTEILALPSQGVYQTKVVTVAQNGQTVITPDTGYDAMDGVQVTVNVPEKQLQTKSYDFTTNQTIELLPDTGYDGFDSVTLNINVPSGGTANLQTKNVTYNRNKTYETHADAGYDGLEKVIATVQTPYNAKLFLNTTEMNNDSNPQLNDIAVLYGMIPTAIPENTVFNKWYLPKTIILPRAVTVEIPINFSAGWGGTTLSISSTGFSVGMQLEGDMVDFAYSSVDGITYTRGDVSIDSMWGTPACKFDEDTNILSYTPSYGSAMSYTIGTTEEFNPSEIVGKFFSNGQYQYNGIYKYQGTTNSSLFSATSDIYINNHNSSDYDTWTIDGDMKYDKSWSDIQSVMTKVNTLTNNNLSWGMIEYITNRKMRVYLYKYHNSSNTYYSNLTLLSLYNYNGDKNTYVGCNMSSSYTIDGVFIYEVDLDNDSIQDVTSQYTISTITVMNGSTPITVMYTTFVDLSHDFTYVYKHNNQKTDLNGIIVTPTNAYSYTGFNKTFPIGMNLSYSPAETQFTLNNNNQLLPEYIALGSDGSHTGDGSIYNNLDISQVLTTVLNRDLIISNNYITNADNNHIKYFKYNIDGDGTLIKTHTTPFYNAVYNTSYTPLKANYYGFEYISLDGKTYCYLNTDRNLVIVDLDTNTSTVITLATLTSTSNNSVILLRGRESLLYAKSDGYAYLYDIPSKTESKLSIPINTSAYYGFRVEYDDEDYALIQINASGTSANKSIYVLNTKTLSVVTSISGTYTFCGAWKSNNGVYYFATQSMVYLYKFDGTSITRLRTSGMSMLTVNANECLEDNSYIYLISNNKNFTKVAKSGTTANATIAATYNISETNVLSGFLRFDNDYVWIITYTGTNYYMTKCTYSLTSQVPAFVEIQKVKIPYKMSFYKNASDMVVTSNIFFNTGYIRLTETGFKEYAARTDTYDTSTYKVGSYEVKFIEESVFDGNDIIGAAKQSAVDGVYYPIYDL